MKVKMKNQYKFMNDILKPWDELNKLLTKPYCVQPELSSITKIATDISISISHFAEVTKIAKRWDACKDSLENEIMIDIADKSKHGTLKKKSRENNISVSSMFEYIDDTQYKFIRNKITVEHTTYGQYDFMEISLNAIQYWLKELELVYDRNILISDNQISRKATLIFNPDYCIHAESSRYFFVTKNEEGIYIPYDPFRFCIEILDMNGTIKAYADVSTN
jgi:hypothetical protein